MNSPFLLIKPVGNIPVWGNPYVTFWTFLNILYLLVPLVIVVLIICYIKQKSKYQQQLLNIVDSLISLLESKRNDEQ